MADNRVGTIGCFVCGNESEVRQNRGRGHHLYYHCDNCGTVQPNKAQAQQKIWDTATFDDQSSVRRPNNVTDSGTKPVNEPVINPDNPKKLPETEPVSTKVQPEFEPVDDDFNPNDEPEHTEQLPEKTGSSGVWVAVILGLGAIGAGLLT